MKKILCILLCMVMLLSLLAGCGGKDKGNGGGETTPTESTKHKHTYESEWSHDETNHWYQANCEHPTLQANLGEHVDEDLDGVCDICAYAYTGCAHTFAETWSSDATSHWHAATCNHIGIIADKADHADADNDGACDVCGYMGDHEHTFSDVWTNDETSHWHDSSCGHAVVSGKEDHVDMTNDGICDVCGLDFSGCEHTFSDEWKTDVIYHWHAATCAHIGAVSAMELHTDADENGYCDTCDYLMCEHQDFDLDGECDICGWFDPTHTHEYGEAVSSDVTGHWYTATCHPGASSAVEAHEDEDNNGVCDVCEFQICGHSYDDIWSYDETHHWHGILCTCSIARKDYAEHVDANGDGGCDVCMYGLPVEAVYETIVDNAPIQLVLDKMITYTPFTVNFPQPGRYVITPNRGDLDIRVWMTDGSDYGTDGAFFNSGGALTLEVEEAGEMTLWFRMFSWTYGADVTHDLTYSVVRMDELIIETMQGKVELPANTIYTAKFVATEIGTYKLITGVDGIVIGLTEDTMEYFKGHVELKITEIGQEFTFYILYEDESVNSFIFDWRLEPPFSLSVGEGNYAVDVAPGRIDYKIEFTAPEAGYYQLKVASQWLTFCRWDDAFNEPVRLETMQILTPYMEAGEVFTTWLETVYDYPAATNCYDTLTITNVGEKLSFGALGEPILDETVYGSAENNVLSVELNIPETGHYRITVTGARSAELYAGEDRLSGIDGVYDVSLSASIKYTIRIHGEGRMNVQVIPVDYSAMGGMVTPGATGSRYCFQAMNNCYYRIEVTNGELGIIAPNGNVSWTKDVYEVNMKVNDTYSFMLRGDGEVGVKVTEVDYSVDLVNGDNTVTLEPNRHYNVNFLYRGEGQTNTVDMDSNNVVALSWEGSLYVYVNGQEYKQGTSLRLMESEVTIMVKSNGAAEVKIQVTILEDANNRPVDGTSEAVLEANQAAILAVNRDGDGAKATFTATVGGTYTLTTYDAKAMIYVVAADGTKTQVLVGAGDYSFALDGGETIEFFVDTTDNSVASISLVVAPGR